MIRPLTLLTMLLAAGAGAYLFAVKHHAQMLDDQIADISQASRLDSQRIRVLQAQWALETAPTRLQVLAAQFTRLQPMQPAQLVTLAALRTSLPAPGSAAPAANPELSGQMLPELEASNADPQPLVPGALPLPPPLAPAPVMIATDAPAIPAHLASRPFTVHAPRRANHIALGHPELAARDSMPHNSIFTPSRIASQTVAMPVRAFSPLPAYVPRAATIQVDDAGSALGMVSALPPPQPISPGIDN